MRQNTDGCTRMILLNSLTIFAFTASKADFYSLGKRLVFLLREFNEIIDVEPSVFRINSRLFREKFCCRGSSPSRTIPETI